VLSAPWHGVSGLGWVIDLIALAGLVYLAIVLRRARRQKAYKPVMEDWIWHIMLPLVAYAGLLAAGLLFRGSGETALFLVAGAALILLYVGIHNAWDTATYLATARPPERVKSESEGKPSSGNRPPAS
jgi:hypothetical protein